jgi:hypothetical protein
VCSSDLKINNIFQEAIWQKRSIPINLKQKFSSS